MQLHPVPVLQWLKAEPLVHFLLLGAMLFVADYAINTRANGQNGIIAVTAQDVDRLRAQSRKQWGREPTPAEVQALVQDFVREEVLVREARAQGLDQDDQVVRRRLAQKMEFLSNQEVEPPTPAQVQAYYASNTQRYQQPVQVDLEQHLFRTDLRGDGAAAAARDALKALQAGQVIAADVSMPPAKLVGQDATQLQREFGPDFARAALAAPAGQWSGPVASPFGLHVLRVHPRATDAPAALDTVRERVLADMVNERIAAAREQSYAALRQRYTVMTPALQELASTPAPAAGLQLSAAAAGAPQ